MADIDNFASLIFNQPATFFESDVFKASVEELKVDKSGPDTLQKIVLDSISKNRTRYLEPICNFSISGCKNPFANLPKSFSQELLEVFVEGDYPEKLCLILQLLNQQTTEFDYTKVCTTPASSHGAVIFRHMLLNCPKMYKAEVTNQVWTDDGILLRVYLDDLFPMMADKWQSLRYLTLNSVVKSQTVQVRFSGVHTSLLHAVSVNLPNLRGLKMHVSFYDYAVNKEVKLLYKMRNLRSLDLTFWYKPNPKPKHVAQVVQTAGALRRLGKFAFKFTQSEQWHPTYYACFVQEYARKYPEKRLIIESLWLSSADLEIPWPKNLAVEQLNLSRMPSITNIMAIKWSVQKLLLHKVRPLYCHMLTGKFGSNRKLTNLDIQLTKLKDWPEEKLDLFKVISSCPGLVHINILMDFEFLLTTSVPQLTPAHFKNCQYFAIENVGRGNTGDVVVHLHKMFLLGSKVMLKTLKISCLDQMQAIEFVLSQETETCLEKLQHVCFYMYTYSTEPFLQAAFKTLLRLYKHSQCLKKVTLYTRNYSYSKTKIPLWFSKALDALNLRFVQDTEQTGLFYKEARYTEDSYSDEEDLEEEEEEEEEERYFYSRYCSTDDEDVEEEEEEEED